VAGSWSSLRHEDEKPDQPFQPQTAFVRYAPKESGFAHVRFHDLRHTCATLLLSQNTHPKFVQELLGHATIATTLDTYSHAVPGMGDPPHVLWKTPLKKTHKRRRVPEMPSKGSAALAKVTIPLA